MKLLLLIILSLPTVSFASSSETFTSQLLELLKALTLLALLTPFGWAAIIIIIILVIINMVKAGKHVVTTDYSTMPENKKKEIRSKELREVFKSFK
jgi:hypothetical protein